MGHVHGQHLRVDLHGVGVQQGPPVDVLGAHDYGLLSLLLPEDSHMNKLVQLQEHGWVEAQLLIVPNDVEDEGLVEDVVYLGKEVLGLEALAQESH